MKHILKCRECGSYTMSKKCSCGGDAIIVRPAKFSVEDAYGGYRRKAKRELLAKEGLL